VIALTNSVRGWEGTDQLTLRECIARTQEGKVLLGELHHAPAIQQLYDNTLVMTGEAGRAMTGDMLGILCEGIKDAEAAEMFGVSVGTIRKAREHRARVQMNPKVAGPLLTLQQKPGTRRAKISAMERQVTIAWFHSKNPSRSGDTKPIAWMSLEKVDFYFEEYRNGYASLMKMAFVMYPELREQIRERAPRNQWERNLLLYLNNDRAQSKTYEVETPRTPLTSAQARAANSLDAEFIGPPPMPASVDAIAAEGLFVPRCYEVFYFNILKKINIRKRPPVNYCEMCTSGPGVKREMQALQTMLSPGNSAETDDSDRDEEEDANDEAWKWGKYGTREKAAARERIVRRMSNARDQHVLWYRRQRPEVISHVEMQPCV
jgi:hypothetical protein